MSEIDLKQLEDEGWQRQHVDVEPRLGEAVETYESLGFEVLLVPVLQVCASEGEAGSCTACFEADEDPEKYKVIFTRRRGENAASQEDGLF
jgi:hypothetical protein